MARLPREFYHRATLDVARDLIGKVLVHGATAGATAGVATAGVIVEVEAYIGETDPACHAAAGPTRRNAPLYGPPGFSYVYLNYGIHNLFNVVTEDEGFPAAVLIRALEPLEGIDLMRRRRARGAGGRRSRLTDSDLCRGPGNLAKAMGITLADNLIDLLGNDIFIEDRGVDPGRLVWGSRIGISAGTEHPWRVWVDGHPAVSATRAVSDVSAVRATPRAGAVPSRGARRMK